MEDTGEWYILQISSSFLFLILHSVQQNISEIHLKYLIPPKRSEGVVRKSIMDCSKNCGLPFLQSVTSFSSHTIEARGLKFGMHNPYMNASKVAH